MMPFAIVTVGEFANIFLVAILTYTAIVWARRAQAAFNE
jgi:hypothetical protein